MDPVLHYLEFVNAQETILASLMVCVFLYYMVKNWKRGYKEVRALLAMAMLFLGEAMIQAGWWVTRWLENEDISVPPSAFFAWNITGRIALILGTVCVLRIFLPYRLGRWLWMVLVGASFFGASLSYMSHIFW